MPLTLFCLIATLYAAEVQPPPAPAVPTLPAAHELLAQTETALDELQGLLDDLSDLELHPAAEQPTLKAALDDKARRFQTGHGALLALTQPNAPGNPLGTLRDSSLKEFLAITAPLSEDELTDLKLKLAQTRLREKKAELSLRSSAEPLWRFEKDLNHLRTLLQEGHLAAAIQKTAGKEKEAALAKWQQESPKIKEEKSRLDQELAALRSQELEAELKSIKLSLAEERIRQAELALTSLRDGVQAAQLMLDLVAHPTDHRWLADTLDRERERTETFLQEKELISRRKEFAQSLYDRLKTQSTLTSQIGQTSLMTGPRLELPPGIEDKIASSKELVNLVTGEELAAGQNGERQKKLVQLLEDQLKEEPASPPPLFEPLPAVATPPKGVWEKRFDDWKRRLQRIFRVTPPKPS